MTDRIYTIAEAGVNHNGSLKMAKQLIDVAAEAGADAVDTQVDGLKLRVSASLRPKCERCWHHREDVGSDASHPQLCQRCVDNIEGAGEKRSFA